MYPTPNPEGKNNNQKNINTKENHHQQ